MSKTYLRGSKRLAIIQNWLNGKEDDEWEVLPTKKDGKYIVKARQSVPKPTKTSKKDLQVLDNDIDNDIDDDNDDNSTQTIQPQQTTQPQPKSKPKKYLPLNTPHDPTINLQILEQLKLLGNELKYEREKKQQKQIIKHQITKQLNHQQHSQQIIYKNEPETINEPQQQSQPQQQPIINEPQQPQPQQQQPKRRRLDLRNL